MKRAGSKILKIFGGLAISAFFIWLTLRGSDLDKVWASFRTANYLYLIPYCFLLVVIHFCRVYRWGILLEPVGKPGFKKLNSAGAIGFMALVIMPFRLGEVARPLLIAEKGKIRRSAAMASVVVERVVDGLAMAVVLIVALLFSTPSTDPKNVVWARVGGLAVFGFFFVLLVFLVFAYLKRDLAVKVMNAVASPVSKKLAAKCADMLDAFIGGLKVVPDRKKVVLFFLLTAIYWGVNAGGMALLASGFGLSLPLAAAFTVLGLLVVGVMIPAGPGMLGTFQGAVVFGMQLFFPGPAFEGAIQAYAWTLWAAQFGQQVLFGLVFLALGHVSLGSLWATNTSDDEEGPSALNAA